MADRSPLTLEDVINYAWHGAADPDLSGDGRFVVYTYEGSLWQVDTNGDHLQRLTEGSMPRWSPAGEEIAFLRGEPAQVWVRSPNGTERPVTDLNTGVSSFAWSADGQHLANISPSEKASGDDPNQPPTTIVEVHQRPPLPSGNRLSITALVTGDTGVLATAAPGTLWSDPVWSQDGRRIALLERVEKVGQWDKVVAWNASPTPAI